MVKVPKTIGFWITFFIGVSFAYFIWLTWNNLTKFIGDSNIVWLITGIIVVIGIFGGFFGFKEIAKKFT